MKVFHALATDEMGRRSAGRFEAESEEAARAKLEAQGYTVLSLEMVREGKLRRDKGARFQTEDGGKRPLGLKGPFIGAAVALVVIPAALMIVSPMTKTTAPDEVVRQFIARGFRTDFSAAFDLLSGRYQKQFSSPQDYGARTVRAGIFPAPPPDEKSRRDEILKLVVEQKKYGRARIKTMIIRHEKPVEMLFFMVKEVGKWKVNFFRNATLANTHLEFIADHPDQPRSRRYRRMLIEEAGFKDGEIEQLVEFRKQIKKDDAAAEGVVEQALGILEKMKQNGMLTEEEFKARKESLLSGNLQGA